ncbi:Acetyl-CoA acetyltransferase [Sphingobium faniae]|nr:Acetyl-CoA acetyltransferase [Sphingobium faniae]
MSRSHVDNMSRRAAIVGIGATEFSKNSGRSELRLATEAIQHALNDAGLKATDVDGLTTYMMDTNPEVMVAQAIGAGDLTLFSRVHYGGGAPAAMVHQAAMAVTSGAADVVICYRAFNERSGLRFGSGVLSDVSASTAEATRYSWVSPYGLRTPASWVAMFAQRYLHRFGATTEAFGHVAVACRKHAATNPAAHFYGRPITLEDHQKARWISEPLRLLDCCQETDGAQALIVTTVERARDLRQDPAIIAAVAQGSPRGQQMMTSFYRDDMTGLPESRLVGDQLWRNSGFKPSDIDVAILYDHFTPFVLSQLEELGFCGVGEAKDFVKDGALEIGGRLPINTHGGQLGEAYLHGMNGVAEAVRQVRGTAVNQVADARAVIVTGGTGVPSSGLILEKA